MNRTVTHVAGNIVNNKQKCLVCGLILQRDGINEMTFDENETVIEINDGFKITNIKKYATVSEWENKIPCSAYYAE